MTDNMTAAKIAKLTKDIFNYALNIDSIRENNYSRQARASVDTLMIHFVDAIDAADNDAQAFYDAMRADIRRVHSKIAATTCLNRDEDEAFFAFERALERVDTARELMPTLTLIHSIMKATDDKMQIQYS